MYDKIKQKAKIYSITRNVLMYKKVLLVLDSFLQNKDVILYLILFYKWCVVTNDFYLKKKEERAFYSFTFRSSFLLLFGLFVMTLRFKIGKSVLWYKKRNKNYFRIKETWASWLGNTKTFFFFIVLFFSTFLLFFYLI